MLIFPKQAFKCRLALSNQTSAQKKRFLREVYEKTGLSDFTEVYFLGEQIRYMRDFNRDEVHHRYFYHLPYAGNPSTTWRYDETSVGIAELIVFEFSEQIYEMRFQN